MRLDNDLLYPRKVGLHEEVNLTTFDIANQDLSAVRL